MRYLIIACLGLSVLVVRPTMAQPGSRPDAKKLEAEVKALQDVLKEKEDALKKVKESEKKGPPFGKGFGPPPFAKGFDPEKMKEMKERFEKMKEGDKKGPFGKGFDPAKMKEKFEQAKKEADKKAPDKKGPPEGKGPPAFARGKFGPPHHGRHAHQPSMEANRGGSELERRLDRIAAELDAIRKELKKR